MATYASATNPFLRPTSNGFGRPNRKEAPGMAIQRVSEEPRSSELIPTTAKRKSIITLGPSDPCGSELDDINNNGWPSNEINGNSDSLLDSGDDNICNFSVESDDIAKTCQMLVEETIKRELEETSADILKPIESPRAMSSRRSSASTSRMTCLARKFSFIEIEDDDGEEDDSEASAPMEKDDRRYQHIELIKKLRLQLRDLERYAYERGELDQVPPSVLAERQTVILETLKERLSLNVSADDIERKDSEDLKRQIDKEIRDLIDPLVTKEHLLNQLKTQLTDLERYISHLHETIGKKADKKSCLCQLHGCSPRDDDGHSKTSNAGRQRSLSSSMSIDALPRTSRLIRSLVTQLISSEAKLQNSTSSEDHDDCQLNRESLENSGEEHRLKHHDNRQHTIHIPAVGKPNFHDGAAWTLHIDKITLATDSITNLFTLDPKYQRQPEAQSVTSMRVDENLVESIVRRQLVPAIKELLSYGLIDPTTLPRSTSSYFSVLFDPYYLLTSLTCFPNSQKSSQVGEKDLSIEKFHLWHVIEDYYKSKSGPQFKTSSVKTLSQSFNLGQSMTGPIKITSKQALLIAVDDIIETLSKCKPNGPESHFKIFIYTAINRSKLSTWLRLVFRNKSVIRKYYQNFSFVSQPDKMNKFLTTLDSLSQFKFNLSADVKSVEQFVSAF